MEISITWNICRVCLKEENKSAKISDNEPMSNIFIENKMLAEYIYEFSGILMQPNDSLPDKICAKCLKMVNSAIRFKKNCRNSNVYLLSLLERTKKPSTLFKPVQHIDDADDDDDEEEIMKIEATNFKESENDHGETTASLVPQIKENSKKKVRDIPPTGQTTNLKKIIDHTKEISGQTLKNSLNNISEEKISNIKSLRVQNLQYFNIINKETKAKTSQLQKFLMSANFTKFKNSEEQDPENCSSDENDLVESLEDNLDNIKENHVEIYKELQNNKNDNSFSNDKLVTQKHIEECLEYVENGDENMEEDQSIHFEEDCSDNGNQAQDSSTIDPNDGIIFVDENSYEVNEMSNFTEEYIADDDMSIHNSSLQEYNVTNVNCEKETNTIIFPKNKSKSYTNCGNKRKVTTGSNVANGEYLSLHICEICGNKFSNRNLLNLHMKVHFQEKNHHCELCFKGFITACNLQAHMRIHTGEKPFKCKYCSRRFNDRTSNIRHERIHTNEKPFKCSNCGKTFTLATTLQNHIKVHTNERLFRCDPCGKSFKLSHHLKTHQNTTLHRSVLQLEDKR